MTESLRALWASKTLWIFHVLANALLAWGVYWWLGIPDRTIFDLLLALGSAVAILIAISWVHRSTLEHFRIRHEQGASDMRRSFRPSIRGIALFAVWAVLLFVSIVLILQLKDYAGSTANTLASSLTLRLRRPVTPESVGRLLTLLINAAAFGIAPFLFLLLWNRSRHRTFLLIYVTVFLICAYLPYRLVWWVPKLNGIYGESVSMTIRFTAAYLLAVTGWLVLASTLGQVKGRRET